MKTWVLQGSPPPCFYAWEYFLIDPVIIPRLHSQKKTTDLLEKKKKMTCRQKDESQQSLYEEQRPQKVSGPFLNIQGSESRGLGYESPGTTVRNLEPLHAIENLMLLWTIHSVSVCQSSGVP